MLGRLIGVVLGLARWSDYDRREVDDMLRTADDRWVGTWSGPGRLDRPS